MARDLVILAAVKGRKRQRRSLVNDQISVALLGIDGFAVTAAQQVDGEIHIAVELDGTVPVGCPECGIIPTPAALKERKTVRVRVSRLAAVRWCWRGPNVAGVVSNRPVTANRSPKPTPRCCHAAC
jgi:hypothetical protein